MKDAYLRFSFLTKFSTIRSLNDNKTTRNILIIKYMDKIKYFADDETII
jgi:hypothetical protein